MRALVIDDEAGVREFVAEVLREEGFDVHEAETAERAFEMMREGGWTLVFCDIMLGGADGFSVLRRFAEEQPGARVVLMTGKGSAEGALTASAGGAYDYMLKPFGVAEVIAVASAVRERAKRLARAAREGEVAATPDDERTRAASSETDDALVGRSPALVEVMKLVGRVAPTRLPVLVTGESGTGKEIVAQRIHRHSPRRERPFVAVNCGAIPSELIESELFGHVRGAFTGAERERAGLFEEASGGTIFLDEITETPPSFQVKLLRALQKGEVRRVGANQTARVDVRVVAASNRDVAEEARAGRFRQDLLYRLNAVTIHLPPLRERREDIMPLAEHFAARLRAQGAPPVAFTREAAYLLETYDWPGNVRELENAVARAVTLSDSAVRPEDLPPQVRRQADRRIDGDPAKQGEAAAALDDGWPSLSEIEGRYAARVLAHTGGNKQAATRILRVDPKTLDRIIKRHNLAAGGRG